MSSICRVLAAICFPTAVIALANTSTIQQHCFKGSGLQPLVFVGRYKEGDHGSDVATQYNSLDPTIKIDEIPCESIRGEYTVVHYLYGSILLGEWLAAIDRQPRLICMDHSFEAGFDVMMPEKLPMTSAKIIYTGMDRSKTDSSRQAQFRSYDLCLTYSLTKFLDMHHVAVAQALEGGAAEVQEHEKDQYRFVVLIHKCKGWRIWFLARLYEYDILPATLYTLPGKPQPCSFHSKNYDAKSGKCSDHPHTSKAAEQFARDVKTNTLDNRRLIDGRLSLSEYEKKAMIPRGRVHVILESEPSSTFKKVNICHWTERVTEKTWHAISFGHAFILVGTFLSLDLVRAHGFKTFSPCINETYGTISDESLKLQVALDEVRRLHALSDEEYDHLYESCLRPRAMYNYGLFHSAEYKQKQAHQRLWAWGIAKAPGFDLESFRAKCDDVAMRQNKTSLSKCRR